MQISIFHTWPPYAAALALALNDHLFKYLYPGFFTGKLSDFVGLFLLALVLRGLWPRATVTISVVMITGFVFWKSPLSQALIDGFNVLSPLPIARTVDYTDLVALIVLPLAHWLYGRRNQYTLNILRTNWLRIPAICLTVLAITGTSVAIPHHQYEIRKEAADQTIDIPKAIEIISKVAIAHHLSCKRCDPAAKEGLFSDNEITLSYEVMENNRGIRFDIHGQHGGLFVGGGSWEEMDRIKSRLQYELGNAFADMEFAIELGEQ